MEGYSHNEYYNFEAEDEDDEDDEVLKTKVKYTVLKEEDFIDEEE